MARCFYCHHCGKCGPGSYDPHRLEAGTCPFCNTRNEPNARICASCGKTLPLAAGMVVDTGKDKSNEAAQ